MQVKIKKLHADAVLPYYDHPGDAGLALYTIESKVLAPGERYSFDIGIALEFPADHVALIMDRSGLAHKRGITTLAGVGDSGYRGSYHVVLINLSDEPYAVNKGDKIAQLLITPVEHANIEEVAELTDSSRGTGGFGSTGR
ncbi:MAG: dUTP diphosphatase [Patescibacteria group bacterium]